MAKSRDWAGFFAALTKMLAELLPLIIPLFTGGTVTKSEPRSQKRRLGPKRESPPDPGR
jgi:hypothetical protein